MDEKVVEFTWLVCLLDMYAENDIWQDIIINNTFNIEESIDELNYELKYRINNLDKADIKGIEFYSNALKIAEGLKDI